MTLMFIDGPDVLFVPVMFMMIGEPGPRPSPSEREGTNPPRRSSDKRRRTARAPAAAQRAINSGLDHAPWHSLQIVTLWESLGLAAVLVLWGACGLVPWCAALIVGRGRGALVALPVAFVAGVAAGALTPALGGKDSFGFGISLLAATAAGAVASAIVVRRAAKAAAEESS